MRWAGSDDDYAALTSPLPMSPDPALEAWRARLATLPHRDPRIREAIPLGPDARRMWDLQLICEPINPLPLQLNVKTIEKSHVLLAEIDEVHVGLCVSSPGSHPSDPLYVQVVAVAPEVRKRGVGIALLSEAAQREPERDIALATRLDNHGARAMIARFAHTIGGNLLRVKLGTYRPSDLGFRRDDGHRTWVIERSGAAPSGKKQSIGSTPP